MKSTFALFVLILLTGCLKTRAELRGETGSAPLQQQTVAQQRAQQTSPAATPAPVRATPQATLAARQEELEEQMRALNGRVDAVENHLTQYNAAYQTERENGSRDKQALDQRFVAYEDALKKLEAQVLALNEEIARLKAPLVKGEGSLASRGRSAYDDGEDLFKNKKWKEAIVAYQKYRDGSPKGKKYPDATYKIGVAFQELGMKDEARAFFEEVKEKFPASPEAKKATTRMKSLK